MTIAAVPGPGLDARYTGPDSAEPAAEGFRALLADAQAAAPKPRPESRPAERKPARDEKARDEDPGPVDAPADAPIAETDEPAEPAVTVAIAPIVLPVVVMPIPVPVAADLPVGEREAAIELVEATVTAAATIVEEAPPELETPEVEPAAEEQLAAETAPAAPRAGESSAPVELPAPVETAVPTDTAASAEPAVPFEPPAAAIATAPTPTTELPAAETAPATEVPVEGIALTTPAPVPPDDDLQTAAPATAPAPVATAPVAARPATEAPAEATPTRSAPPEPPAEQLVTILRPLRQHQDGTYRLRLEMKPPELGRVELRVEMQDGVLNASLHADNEHAAQTLRDALGELRLQLENHGVRAGTLSVGDGRANGRREPRENLPEHSNRSDRPAETPAATRSRGAVSSDAVLDVRV